MRRTHPAAFVTLLPMLVALAGCHSGGQTSPSIVFPGKQWAVATPESQGLDPVNLRRAVDHVRAVAGEVGAEEMMIIRNGYVVWQGSRTDRVQPIYSCTKSFASTCLGLLWDDGRLSPGDKAHTHWPSLQTHYPDMTLEHMATLTSGYNSGASIFDPAPPAFAPGEEFQYSGQADLLMAIFTRLEGRSMKDLFLDRIGNRIGIDPNEFDWGTVTTLDGIAVNGGAGRPPTGIHISARMLARFGWLYCNLGQWDGRQLVSRRYVDYATVPRTSIDTPPHDPNAWYVSLPGNYGLNWWTNGPTPGGQPHWPSAPARTFAAQGNRNNICFIIPEWRMVIVRLGGDTNIGMTEYDRMFRLLKESLKTQ